MGVPRSFCFLPEEEVLTTPIEWVAESQVERVEPVWEENEASTLPQSDTTEIFRPFSTHENRTLRQREY